MNKIEITKTNLESRFQAIRTAFATGDRESVSDYISVNAMFDPETYKVYEKYNSFEEVLNEVKKLAVHNKLEAVKLIKRTQLLGGLKDSKDFVDFQMHELQE
jgi:ribosomal protein L7/L12